MTEDAFLHLQIKRPHWLRVSPAGFTLVAAACNITSGTETEDKTLEISSAQVQTQLHLQRSELDFRDNWFGLNLTLRKAC